MKRKGPAAKGNTGSATKTFLLHQGLNVAKLSYRRAGYKPAVTNFPLLTPPPSKFHTLLTNHLSPPHLTWRVEGGFYLGEDLPTNAKGRVCYQMKYRVCYKTLPKKGLNVAELSYRRAGCNPAVPPTTLFQMASAPKINQDKSAKNSRTQTCSGLVHILKKLSKMGR